MLIRGRCHCGNISFDLRWDPDPESIPARACDCTFCVKHGGVWTSHPDAALEISIRDPSRVSAYRFGTRTATFHTCSTCGVVPLVSCEIDGKVHAVVSVNAFEDVDPALIRKAPISFEGEDPAARIDRRKRNWIGSVRFVEGR